MNVMYFGENNYSSFSEAVLSMGTVKNPVLSSSCTFNKIPKE